MSQTVVLEGTGAELLSHLEAHPQGRFRLMTLPEEELPIEKPQREKNWEMLEALEKIAEMQKGRPYTDGSDSLRYLREGRDGEMYDYDPNK